MHLSWFWYLSWPRHFWRSVILLHCRGLQDAPSPWSNGHLLTGVWCFSHGCSPPGSSTVSQESQLFGSLLGRSCWKVAKKKLWLFELNKGIKYGFCFSCDFSALLSFHFVLTLPPWFPILPDFGEVDSTAHPYLLFLGLNVGSFLYTFFQPLQITPAPSQTSTPERQLLVSC